MMALELRRDGAISLKFRRDGVTETPGGTSVVMMFVFVSIFVFLCMGLKVSHIYQMKQPR